MLYVELQHAQSNRQRQSLVTKLIVALNFNLTQYH